MYIREVESGITNNMIHSLNLSSMKKNILLLFTTIALCSNLIAQEDPYLWLEEVEGAKALEFVNNHNKTSIDKFRSYKEYQDIYDKSLSIYDSNERIVSPTIYGDYIYNFWQDKEHSRGIWRRATKKSYLDGQPAWDVLLDLDMMAEKDNVKWVYKGATGLYPDYNLFLVSLSRGGGDAVRAGAARCVEYRHRQLSQLGSVRPPAPRSAASDRRARRSGPRGNSGWCRRERPNPVTERHGRCGTRYPWC